MGNNWNKALKILFDDVIKAKTVKFFCLKVLLCLVLAFPGYLVGNAGTLRDVDKSFEDKIFQGKATNSEQIIIINVDSTSDCLDANNHIQLDVLVEAVKKITNYAQKTTIGIDLPLEFSNVENLDEVINLFSTNSIILGQSKVLSGNQVIRIDDNVDARLKFSSDHSYREAITQNLVVGFTNVFEDVDGNVRHYYYTQSSYKQNDSFALEVYEQYCLVQNIEKINPLENTSRDYTVLNTFNKDDSFVSYNISQLTDNFDYSLLNDKIILFGYNDSYLEECYYLCNNTNIAVSNVTIQAIAINQCITSEIITEVPLTLQLVILEVVIAAIIYITITNKFLLAFILCGFVSIFTFIFSHFLFTNCHLLIHPLYYYVDIVFVLICGFMLFMQRRNDKHVQTAAILDKYIDQGVRERIINSVELGINEFGSKRKVAVLFADIRNFTHITGTLPARTVTSILNTYFEVIEHFVHENNGIIDKFIGDSVMAFWDNEESKNQAVLLACKAAIQINEGIREVDDDIFKQYSKELSTSIGIHFGEGIVGDFGSSSRKAFTVIGETVNIASSLNKIATKGNIYLSDVVANMLQDKIITSKIEGGLIIPGETKPIDVYELEGFNTQVQSIHIENATFFQPKERYTLYILGCRGSFNVSGKRFNEFGGQTTCSILKVDKHAIILDCGTGLYQAREILKDCTKIDVILSHVHYDHCLGLLDWSIFPTGVKADFYGNFRNWLGLRTINELFSAPFWPVDPSNGEYHQIPEYGKMLYLGDDITVRFYQSEHPNGAILSHLMVGDKNIINMVDCEKPEALPIEIIENVDLLIYDGMYDDEEYAERHGWGHSTWQQGCMLAKKAHVKTLIISHHSPKHSDSELLELERSARKIYEHTTFARSGMVIKL